MKDINWGEYEKVESESSPPVKTKHWYKNIYLWLFIVAVIVRWVVGITHGLGW